MKKIDVPVSSCRRMPVSIYNECNELMHGFRLKVYRNDGVFSMIKLFQIINLLILLLCFFFSSKANADVPDNQIKEVEHLLAFVKKSGCTINRNGTGHPAKKGVNHIENKYNYFRDDIKNTEDFIEYSATKSTMSGDYYTVACSGKKTIKTQDWLLAELQKFRSK